MTECARCGREGTFKMRAVWPPGAPALCQDTDDCAAAQLDQRVETAQCEDALEEIATRDRAWSEGAAMFAADDDTTWEVSTEHDALQRVMPLDGDVTQGALL